MSGRPDRLPPGGRGGGDPERALLAALRRAVVPGLCLPLAIAWVAASATRGGPHVVLVWPLAALALVANLTCWLKVIALWRALPRPDDDDQGWRSWWERDSPLDPDSGPGGIKFDWPSFERDFWDHVRDTELQRERELVHALA